MALSGTCLRVKTYSCVNKPFTSSTAAPAPLCRPARRARLAAAAAPDTAADTDAQPSTAGEPTITIQFLQPGGEPVSVTTPSGDQLRAVMLDEKVELYTTWGKIWTCGGVGQCGTCIVEVVEGAELLSERNANESKKLNRKPESWRLACQTIVGDGENSGKVVIRTKPQG